jgi:hypothetical protein
MRLPADLRQPWQLLVDHFLVQEQQRAQGLAVRGGRHLALRGQHGQERLDLRLRHLPRMPHAVKADEMAHPVNVGLLGAQAVVQITEPLPQLPKDAGHLQHRARGEAEDFGVGIMTVHTYSITPHASKIKRPRMVRPTGLGRVPALFRRLTGYDVDLRREIRGRRVKRGYKSRT